MTEQEMRVRAKALFDETLDALRWLQESDPEAPEGLESMFRSLVHNNQPWSIGALAPHWMDGMDGWKGKDTEKRHEAFLYLSREDVGLFRVEYHYYSDASDDDGPLMLEKEAVEEAMKLGEPVCDWDTGEEVALSEVCSRYAGTDKLKAILEGKPSPMDARALVAKWSKPCKEYSIDVWREYLLANNWWEDPKAPETYRFLKKDQWGLYPHCIDLPKSPSFEGHKRNVTEAVITLCNTEDTTPAGVLDGLRDAEVRVLELEADERR